MVRIPADARKLTRRISQAKAAIYDNIGDPDPTYEDIADYINDQPGWKNRTAEQVKNNILNAEKAEGASLDEAAEIPVGREGTASSRKSKSAKLGQTIFGDEFANIAEGLKRNILNRRPEGANVTADQLADANNKIDSDARKYILDKLKGKNLTANLTAKDLASKLADMLSTEKRPVTSEQIYNDYLGPKADRKSEKAQDTLRDRIADMLVAQIDATSFNEISELGKQQGEATPSPQLDFNIQEGKTATSRDTVRKPHSVVNTHNFEGKGIIKALRKQMKQVDFNKDWLGWVPGTFGQDAVAKGRKLDVEKSKRMLDDVLKVNRMAAAQGLSVRKDARNPGMYHIYKKGAGTDYNLTEKQAANEVASKPYLDKVVAALKKAWPDTKIASDNFSWVSKVQGLKLQGVAAPWSKMKGFVTEGKVFLNPDLVGYDTPIHELGHLWASELQRVNPKLWKRGVELLKGSEYARAVYDIPTYKAYLKDNPSKFWEEVMANAIGKRGAVLFNDNKKAGAWDNWMNKVGSWIKDKLDISSKKDYADLTLDDWLNVGVQGTFAGKAPKISTFDKGVSVDYNLKEDPQADPDVAAAQFAGEKVDWVKQFKTPVGKIKIPRRFMDLLVPPAADDYHGLVSKIKNLPGVDAVTKAFVESQHKYLQASTDARNNIKDIRNKLADAGVNLNDKSVATIEGNKLSAAQAIQAHVDGLPTPFTQKPAVQKYIKSLTDMGVLKPSKGNRNYKVASPDYDTVNHIVNDLYIDNFQNFAIQRDRVFSDAAMAKLRGEKGNKFVDALDNALGRMATGKTHGNLSDPTTSKWTDWLLGSVGNIMFLNFRSAGLQTLSTLNYGFETANPGRFLAALFDPSTFAEAKKLYNDPYLKERRARAGFDVNANEMMTMLQESDSFGDFTKKALNFGFRATSFVDSVAIAFGGAAFMKSNGGVNAANKKKWIEASEEAQQSSRPDRVSQWQTTGAAKYILAFANTPQQYFRLSQKALRSIREGKDVKRNIAKMGYYFAAQNALFTMAQQASFALIGIEDDDEKAKDALDSMASTVLRGMGLYGAVIDALKNVGYRALKEQEKSNPDYVAALLRAVSISPPLNRKIQELQSIGRAHQYGQDDKWTTTVAKGTAIATNLPTDYVQKKYNAVMELNNEKFEAWQKILMLLGWSKWNFKDNSGDVDFDDIDFDDIGDVEF